MRGRPSLYDNDSLIEKAMDIFWTKGYSATALADLLQGMNIGSGSFYNTFKGGKKELFIEALKLRRQAFNKFSSQLKQSSKPIELIKDFFRSLASADYNTHLRGCVVANAVAEMAFIDADLEKEAVDILKDVELLYTDTIRKAQINGALKNQTDAGLLGRYLINVYNGINITRRMYPEKKELINLIKMQLEIIS